MTLRSTLPPWARQARWHSRFGAKLGALVDESPEIASVRIGDPLPDGLGRLRVVNFAIRALAKAGDAEVVPALEVLLDDAAIPEAGPLGDQRRIADEARVAIAAIRARAP